MKKIAQNDSNLIRIQYTKNKILEYAEIDNYLREPSLFYLVALHRFNHKRILILLFFRISQNGAHNLLLYLSLIYIYLFVHNLKEHNFKVNSSIQQSKHQH